MNIHIPADFTLAELRAFIEGEEKAVPEGFYTAREWAKHFDIDLTSMRELLKQAKKQGLLQMTWIRRKTLDERTCRVPVYALQSKSEDPDPDKQPVGEKPTV